ncbi:zf-HC2 domain-containing protein [Halomonas sp. C22]|uniref:zf-HC2 domain-containing protein n=1 Tax=Halomonas sp. C22 TaxID=2580567 RepID=UPI0028CBB6F7|nr:zf-HC2 domain-containing protein [Halomonas sp. C22]
MEDTGMMMCREATRLMSLRIEQPLTFQQKAQLALHLSMCGACRLCDKQFRFLHDSFNRHPSKHGDINNK